MISKYVAEFSCCRERQAAAHLGCTQLHYIIIIIKIVHLVCRHREQRASS